MALIDIHRETKPAQVADPDWNGFLAELTLLSEKYGVGLSDATPLFAMERDDYGYNYGLDDQGRLLRR